MATKAPTKKPSQSHLASPLYSISPATQLIASELPLPIQYSIIYAQFSPTTLAQQYQDVDSARKLIFDSNSTQPLLSSILTHVDVSKGRPSLWAFCIDSDDASEDSLAIKTHFVKLSFQGLHRSDTGSFAYREIYPCSPSCSERRDSCPGCVAQHQNEPSSQGVSPFDPQGTPSNSTPLSTPSPTNARSATCFLPRRPLRKPVNFFLDAVRERFIDDVCKGSPGLRRLRNGVLLGFTEMHSGWGDGWDQHQRLRTLVFCQLETCLFPNSIILQPRLRPTQFLPLLVPAGLIPGTPINLLPYFTPAYFLNHYSGPTSALIRQFQANLMGLGAGHWPAETRDTNADANTQFIIVWVNVENRQGEEKGMIVVWPTDLCVSVPLSSKARSETENRYAYHRKQLSHIPELPAALQSSPIPAPAIVPAQRGISPNETKVFSTGPSSVDWGTSPQNETSPLTPFQVHPSLQAKFNRPFVVKARSSFFAEMLHSHKALTKSWMRRQNVRRVSVYVGKYVDSVAKERERERERMRKEREAAVAQAQKEQPSHQNVASSSAAVLTPSNVVSVAKDTATRFGVKRAPSATIMPSITVNLQPLTFPPPTLLPPMGFPQLPPSYPSPPDDTMKADSSTVHTSQQLTSLSVHDVSEIDQQHQHDTSGTEFGDAFGLEKIMTHFNMDFDQNMDSALTGAGQPPSAVDPLHAMELDLSIFTDDDFNFFDDPTTDSIDLTGNQSNNSQEVMSTADPLSGLGISAVFSDNSHTGLFAGAMTTDTQASPWSPSKFAEAFSTGASAFDTSFPAPELVPPSPDKSASSISGPTTPNVLYISDVEAVQSWVSNIDEPFNAIAFPDGIRNVDHKYKNGKFVVQSEGNLMDVDPPVSFSPYADATDPRNGIVRKLIGKRKKRSEECKDSSMLSPSYEEQSEWLTNAEGDSSDASSASEHDSEEEGSFVDEVMTASRPSTPLPSNLPPGPSLLATQFSHSALLPLSTNPRPPGAPFPISDLASPVPNPVPTPVSPAAILGAASEKSKSLESAARMLCRESVENKAWLEEWRRNIADAGGFNEVDEELTCGYLQMRDVNIGTLSIERFCNIARSSDDDTATPQLITTFQPPEFSVGKSDAVISVTPSAIAFWDKLGLSPRSGPKDIVAFVLYQGDEEIQEQIEGWLKRMSLCYSSKGFGAHVPGSARECVKDGLLPVNFESFRKSLTSLINSLDTDSSSLLFYVAIPTSSLSLSSLNLRQILSGLRRASSGQTEKRLHFHFVPQTLFTQSDDYSSALSFEALAMSVYNRINRPIQRMVTRPFGDGHEITTAMFSAPAFTLARSSSPTVFISYKYPITDAGSLDRHTFLHVGYKLSRCRKWLMAACIDMRGESTDVGLWLVQEEHDHKQLVNHLWRFALEFASRANIEWRMVFAKYGSMGEDELDAWNHHFTIDSSFGDLPMHASVTCIEDDPAWLFLYETMPTRSLPHSPHGGGDGFKGQQLITSATSTFALPYIMRIPLASASDIDLHAYRDFIPDEGGDDSSPPEHLPAVNKDKDENRLRPLQTAVLITISPKSRSVQAHTSTRATYVHLMGTYASPSSTFTKSDAEHHKDVLHNYHDLAILTQTRWRHHAPPSKPSLPFHLSALRIMEETLAQNNYNHSANDVS